MKTTESSLFFFSTQRFLLFWRIFKREIYSSNSRVRVSIWRDEELVRKENLLLVGSLLHLTNIRLPLWAPTMAEIVMESNRARDQGLSLAVCVCVCWVSACGWHASQGCPPGWPWLWLCAAGWRGDKPWEAPSICSQSPQGGEADRARVVPPTPLPPSSSPPEVGSGSYQPDKPTRKPRAPGPDLYRKTEGRLYRRSAVWSGPWWEK